ncbi:TPA: hypothetical protein SLD83_001680 [Legionella pneumophila]|uniref:Uncharacterized protein n=1 Tax=Legionella bononiensis TaxID=2793102 RepID=A0ABS1WEQ4_9GAMM|nr:MULTISPECIES: hypothetical protein [Legionellaceae]ERH41457.1 hypothetical protein N750_16450 [Legionella pneumophila str. Leg01/53]ERI46778.1 hypothetical protein N749_16625 [Legionella pneumophila str. Leg01/20]HAT8857986.1 hypothetical protein [Legionella pneumophila subsp. pneumophila]KTD12262.1 hypothetical protein Lhac_1133 [Legionella hackeliae]MBL7478609.1 hypothetical protein [Legionella bononiensis]
MAHISKFLPQSIEEASKITTDPFKIGDRVYFVNDQTNETWTIVNFSLSSIDKKPVAILRSDTFDTYSSLGNIKLIC